MSQVHSIRLPNGEVLTPGDWVAAEPLYSTVEFGSAAFTVLSAFSYSRGASVPGSLAARPSSYSDTNLEGEGGRLPENEELICFNLAIELFMIENGVLYQNENDVLAAPQAPMISYLDMLRMQRDLYVTWKIANIKEYTHAPIGYFPGSCGIAQVENAGATNPAAGSVFGYVTGYNGGVSCQDVRTFASPVYVKGGETFSVDIRTGPGAVGQLGISATNRVRARIYLDGYRRRPVA